MPFPRAALIAFLLLSLVVTPLATAAVPVTLKGSPASMSRQNEIARSSGLVFARSAEQMRDFVAEGTLVPLPGNADYRINDGVSGPYGQPEMRLFIERLAAQYRAATGEQLVVTSITRPTANQPRNSHALSVHPTGMAVDLRISQRAASRKWLESTLLALEARGVLDVTRERRPPHYHVALFPEAYLSYVDRLIGPEALATALLWGRKPAPAVETPPSTAGDQTVPATNRAIAAVESTTRPDHRGPAWLKLLLVIPVAALTADLIRRRRIR